MKTSLFLGTALAAVLVTGMASAAKTTYIAADMTGAKEKPAAVNSAVTGEARMTFDDETKKLCGRITITPKTFVATASHIHEGDANTAGKPVIVFDGFTGELKINKTLTDDEVKALEGKDLYVNVHSETNAGGEVRDQLVEDGDQEPEECEGDTPGDAGATSSSSSSSGSTTTPKGDAGTSGTSATPASTDDGGGCNTSGSSNTGTGLAIAAGLGLALAVASRKRKKA